jgi:hypothetical protein
MAAPKGICTFHAASQTAPPLLGTVNAQVLLSQRVSPAAAVRDTLPANSRWLDIREAGQVAFGGFKSRPHYQLTDDVTLSVGGGLSCSEKAELEKRMEGLAMQPIREAMASAR